MVHLYFKHVLLLCRDVDQKIKVVLGSTPPSNAVFRLNQLFLEEFKNKIKYLMKRNYIRISKHLILPWFCLRTKITTLNLVIYVFLE